MFECHIAIPVEMSELMQDAFVITMAKIDAHIVIVQGKTIKGTAQYDIAISDTPQPEQVLFQIGVLFGQLITLEIEKLKPKDADDLLKCIIKKSFTGNSTPDISKN